MDLLTNLLIFVQIVVESFPISSSGHVELFKKILGFKYLLPDFFDLFLHGSTILILMIVFYKDWQPPIFNLLKGLFDKSFFNKDSYKRLLKIFFKIFTFVFIASFITSMFWLLVKYKLEHMKYFSSNIMLIGGFTITAIFLFLLLVATNNKRFESLDLKKVLILGFVQGIALLPGISRFASVYSISRLLKISPRRAFQITFLLQFPLIIAGFFLGSYDLIQFDGSKFFNLPMIITIVIATIISLLSLYWVRKMAFKQKLWLFGFYMLIPILILICFFRQ